MIDNDSLVEKQIEFSKWLKENQIYNEWLSSNTMQHMFAVWTLSQQEINRLNEIIREMEDAQCARANETKDHP